MPRIAVRPSGRVPSLVGTGNRYRSATPVSLTPLRRLTPGSVLAWCAWSTPPVAVYSLRIRA